MSRLRVLLKKELLDVVRNRAVLIPVVIAGLVFLVLPFMIAIVIPTATGRPLGSDRALERISLALGQNTRLSPTGRVQLFLFQQFLIVFLLMPVTGAMALAAHAIIGEKQARTLEPLLATPLATLELLVAKVIGALLPALAISTAVISLYAAIIAAVAEPGVLRALINPTTLVLVFGVGPLCALVSLQTAVVISSRVNDARTAQQFGVLIVIPTTGIVIAQVTGAVWLTATALAFITLGLGVVWALLALLSVALFDRETILTRWK